MDAASKKTLRWFTGIVVVGTLTGFALVAADTFLHSRHPHAVVFSGPSHERDSIVSYQAQRFGMDPALAIAVSHVENWGGDSMAVHPKSGAIGLMQVMPFWADSFTTECGTENLFNRQSNACRGVMIGMMYFKDCGDWDCALTYYLGAACGPRDSMVKCHAKQAQANEYAHRVLRNLHRSDVTSLERDAFALGGWRRDAARDGTVVAPKGGTP